MNKAPEMRRVYVGPGEDPTIAAAVSEAGATLVNDPVEADTLVWLSPSIPELRQTLHADVDWVQLKSAGIDHVLRSGLVDDTRVWSCARGAYAEEVAEHGLTLMLAASRRLHEILPSREWGDPGTRFGRVLAGSTIAVIGCGAIGTALMRLLEPLRTEVIAVTRSGRQVEGAARSLSTDESDEAFAAADFTVLTAPSTTETLGFVDRRRLELMPDHAWLVNVGRGDLVVTDDLVEVLEAGTIGGAALDVTDPEPLPDGHPLWSLPTIITPHTSNPPEANSRTLAHRVAENLRRLAAGQAPLGEITPQHQY